MDQSARRDQTERAPEPGRGDEPLNALLGKGSEFDGKLSFEGTVRIDGSFTGEISTSGTLVVGEGAKVQAEISCGDIVVRGEVTGNVRASRSVALHAPARLRGDVATPSLSIEKGVVFHGQSKMDDAPARPAAKDKDRSNVFRLTEREQAGAAAEV